MTEIDVSNCTYYVEGECDIYQNNCDKVECQYKWYKRIEAENAKLKEKLEKIEYIINYCSIGKKSCYFCKFEKECEGQNTDLILKIIKGEEDE